MEGKIINCFLNNANDGTNAIHFLHEPAITKTKQKGMMQLAKRTGSMERCKLAPQ